MKDAEIGLRIESYLQLLAEHQHLTDDPEGQLPIVTNREVLLSEQQRLYREADLRGIPREWFDLGIVAQDAWVVVLRDLVRFPNGKFGAYIRTLNRRSQVDRSGTDVVVLATVEDRILLCRHFRHEDRSWHWECPRGFGEKGLSPAENAAKELKEETGLRLLHLTMLNSVAEPVAYFHAACCGSYENQDREESIGAHMLVTEHEVKEMLCDGRINDPFTVRAITLFRIKQGNF